MTICKADAAGRKEAGQRTLGASSPTDFSPPLVSQHRLGADRRLVGNMVLSALAGFGDREDQLNIGPVDGLAPRKPDGPQQPALAQRPSEGATRSKSCISKNAAEPRSGRQ